MAHAFLSLADGLVPRSGTATSHGSIKRHNRLTEVLLHDIEFVATLASTLGGKTAKGKAYEYPKDELDSLWERALLCQFHDVLPGSAIGMVYDDVEKVRSLPCRFLLPSGLWSDDRSMCAQIYADVTKLGVSLLDDALSALIPSSSAALDSVTAGDSLVAVDTSATPRRELVKVPLAVRVRLRTRRCRGAPTAARTCSSRTRARGRRSCMPSRSARPRWRARAKSSSRAVRHGSVHRLRRETELTRPARTARAVGDSFVLSTQKLKVEVTREGRITSIYDKELERELLLEGRTAGFVIFQDTPLNWDAWCAALRWLAPP